jgi:hypothetical protein
MSITKTENGYLVVQKYPNGQSETRGKDRLETLLSAIEEIYVNHYQLA